MRVSSPDLSPKPSAVKAADGPTWPKRAARIPRRWQKLSSKERERIKELLAESGGRIDRLSSKQRKELRHLAGKLDLAGMGKELVALRVVRGRRGRRRGA